MAIHRDDLPMGDAEEIVKHLQEMFFGYRVEFAGDSTNPEARDKADAINAALAEQAAISAEQGTCIDCGEKIPDYPGVDTMSDDWQPPAGWVSYEVVGNGGGFGGWCCPKCDAEDKNV